MGDSLAERVLARTWRPALTVTGATGLPAIENAGNVLRPGTALKLSLRLPPMLEGEKAAEVVREVLEKDPPYGAAVRFEGAESCIGWNAPPLVEWLEEAIEAASQAYFGAPAAAMGEGRHDPVHGHARRRVSRGPVLDHRRSGSHVERPRTERVPAPSDRQAGHLVRGEHPRCSRTTGRPRGVAPNEARSPFT